MLFGLRLFATKSCVGKLIVVRVIVPLFLVSELDPANIHLASLEQPVN